MLIRRGGCPAGLHPSTAGLVPAHRLQRAAAL